MSVHWIDPISDKRWLEFVDHHPASSIFHTPGWLEALRRTYGYQPAAITTSPPGAALTNGIVVCRVNSWLTGRRMVSLPFSDHCQPLLDNAEARDDLLCALRRTLIEERRKYFEIRPTDTTMLGTVPSGGIHHSDHFCYHTLDLRPPLGKISAGFHKDCVKRKIRRAEKEKLEIESGRSGQILQDFYLLQVATRRRQGAPVQSRAWFENLSNCLADKLLIRAAYRNGIPLAAILTLSHGNKCVFKYACSDSRFNALGGIQILLWQVIKEARESGAVELDLGRSEPDNEGLMDFKDRWGAVRSDIDYLRGYRSNQLDSSNWHKRLGRYKIMHLPFRLLPILGRMLYRHFG